MPDGHIRARVGVVHTAAIEYARLLGRSLTITLAQSIKDYLHHLAYFVGLGKLTCPYRPDWLIGNSNLGKVGSRDHVEILFQLIQHHLRGQAIMALLNVFADAQDGLQFVAQGKMHFFAYLLIGFAQVNTTLGVPDNHIARQALDLGSSNLASVGTLFICTNILCTQVELGGFVLSQLLVASIQSRSRRTHHYICLGDFVNLVLQTRH